MAYQSWQLCNAILVAGDVAFQSRRGWQKDLLAERGAGEQGFAACCRWLGAIFASHISARLCLVLASV
jgi:hypothetical protein